MLYVNQMRDIFKARFKNENPLAFIKTFGCQQNEADSEKICGFLKDLGFKFTDDILVADFILFNTCAVRHTAQNRIYGNIGKLKNIKKARKNVFIAVCGCMLELEDEKNEILSKFPYVDFLCGSKSIEKFPEFLYKNLTGDKSNENYVMHALQNNNFKAWIPIISGCNNFCSYCIVPYTRGREKSRKFDDILSDCRHCISNGTKIITFLGQNVNSYNYNGIKFENLLEEVDKIDGDFTIRFMTSHPKDFTKNLVDTLTNCKHFSRQLHLPVQSGNNHILKMMNRKYTREEYIEKVEYARAKIDDLVITTDIIVGFPNETREEFEDTISLLEEIKFFSVFSFIYSPRKGTASYRMKDSISREEKIERINRLISIQAGISEELNASLTGKKFRVFIEEFSNDHIVCRTDSNLIVKISKIEKNYTIGDSLCVKIVKSGRSCLYGEIIKE